VNRISSVMASVLVSSVVDRGFENQSGQTKDYKIDVCCFSAKHTALRRNIKDWLARNQDNVSEWGDMSIRGLLFQWASTPTKRKSRSFHWKLPCSRHMAEKLLSCRWATIAHYLHGNGDFWFYFQRWKVGDKLYFIFCKYSNISLRVIFLCSSHMNINESTGNKIPTHDEVYSIQHYVIQFDSDLWQVSGFLRVIQFPPPIKLTDMLELKYCWMALKTPTHVIIQLK
jgi:hypothetical protein